MTDVADAPLSSILNWGGVGAAMPEAYGANAPIVDPLAKALISSATLPQRLIDTAQSDFATGQYHPGPYLEAAMLPMGTGAIAGVPLRAGESVLGAGPIRAYHGSPYDFDAFNLAKIGTGEGAQAYGHGLYFAENPKVAEEYRNTLADWKVDGNAPNPSDPSHIAAVTLKSYGNPDAAIADLNQTAASTLPESERTAARKAIDLIKSGAELPKATGGHMYEVNINADPEHFLDWNKPLRAQSEHVQNAVRSVPGYAESIGAESPSNMGDLIKRGLIPSTYDQASPAFSKTYGDAGIRGIRYLDQGSRAAGDGSRNYVVFDDKLIDILRKYGMIGAIPAAGSGFGAMAQQGQNGT